MKMNALANASVNRLALIDLRIESCQVCASHEFVMTPARVERFVYIIRGKARFFVGEREFGASTRDMIYLPGETAYHSKWFEDSSFLVVDLLLHDSEGQPIRFEEEANVLFCDSHGVYLGLLQELAEKADTVGPFDWLERLSLSFKLLCEIARDTNRTALNEHSRRIQAGLNYLKHNYCSDFSVDQLAEMCCLSASSFRRSFSECMGVSPVEYRNRLRIQKAVQLLKSNLYNVAETAELVGIRDAKYFSKLFIRYTGITPASFKNKQA